MTRTKQTTRKRNRSYVTTPGPTLTQPVNNQQTELVITQLLNPQQTESLITWNRLTEALNIRLTDALNIRLNEALNPRLTEALDPQPAKVSRTTRRGNSSRVKSRRRVSESRRENLTKCCKCDISKSFGEYNSTQISEVAPVCITCYYQECTKCNVNQSYKAFASGGGNVCKNCTYIGCKTCGRVKRFAAYSRSQTKQTAHTPTCTKCQKREQATQRVQSVPSGVQFQTTSN